MVRILLLCMILVVGTFQANPVLAQGGFFDQAKELMGNVESVAPGASGLANSEIADGLREALRVGTERVVGQLGQTDGFNADPDIHIPLPSSLQKVQSALEMVGMSEFGDDLELKLNRAAEAATPKAKQMFVNAISEMTLEDAEAIYNGPNDSATQYFRSKMSAPLIEEMRPVVDATLSEVGAVQAFDRLMGEYQSLPLVPNVKADLTTYALEEATDGLFFMLAREEAAIRENPAKRTTELLQKVFGQ